jgi:hypothetical protein
MNLFDSKKDMIEQAAIIQKAAKKKVEIATKDELSSTYCELKELENLYGSILSSMEPGTDTYKIMEGVYESQKSLIESIEYRAKNEKIDLPCD